MREAIIGGVAGEFLAAQVRIANNATSERWRDVVVFVEVSMAVG